MFCINLIFDFLIGFHHLNYLIIMQFKIIILISLLLFTHHVQAKCHYSCKNCTQEFYTSCLTCPNNSTLTYVLSTNPNSGACADVPTGQPNALGILLLISAVCILTTFLEQQTTQLFLFMQTLGLCFLVQIYYNPILDYALTGCSYLMILSWIGHTFKQVPLGVNTNVLKGRVFFGSFSFKSNIVAIGSINLIIFFVLVFLPVFKNIRKKCVAQRVHFCPNWLLEKVQQAASICFIFLIQQTVSVIYFSLKYDQFSIADVLITLLYFILLIAFAINHFLYPLPIFRSKLAQTNIIIGKIVTPMFLLSSGEQHFVLFPLAITFSIINTIATNKNKKNGKFNRLLFYNILGIVVLCLLTCMYIVETVSNNAQTSRGLGIACFVGLFGVFSCAVLEVVLKIKQKLCQNHLTQSSQEERENTLQSIDMQNQKQQHARKLSPTLYLQQQKQTSNPKKHESKNDSVVPEPSQYFSPQVDRSNGPSLERQSDNSNKFQNHKVQPSFSLKRDEPLQIFQQIQYGAFMPIHTQITGGQDKDQKQMENNSSIVVGENSKNSKRLPKLRRDKRSSK